jgi:hypothetical protein
VPSLGDKNVGRLDIAVDDSLSVRSIQGIRDFAAQLQHLLRRYRFAGNPFLQRLPVKALHRDKRLSVVLADFINRANVGMVQGGSGLRLAVEAPQSLRVRSELVRQELQGHKTVKPGVLGLVHHTHPAAAKFFDNAVVRDCLPNQE